MITLSPETRMAVIGGGVAGITASYLLDSRCQVTLFEKNDYVQVRTMVENECVSCSIDYALGLEPQAESCFMPFDFLLSSVCLQWINQIHNHLEPFIVDHKF